MRKCDETDKARRLQLLVEGPKGEKGAIEIGCVITEVIWNDKSQFVFFQSGIKVILDQPIDLREDEISPLLRNEPKSVVIIN